jgi:hypothetical protein
MSGPTSFPPDAILRLNSQLAELLSAMAQAVPDTEPVATGVVWSDSGVLTLSVGIPPVITLQPQSQQVSSGDPVTFSVSATGAESYQWRRDGVEIGGATSTEYTIADTSQLDDGAEFDCVVTGPGGQTTSNAATLSVSAFLLDEYTAGLAAAFSLRKLRRDYEGECIRVRRSSDNTEQDFGFSENQLDASALLSFCGDGSGFVTTWYDQREGTARNATQSSTESQPRIVNSGAVESVNGKPSLFFDGTNDSLIITDGDLLRNVPGIVASILCRYTAIRSTPSLSYLLAVTTATPPAARFVAGADNDGWVLAGRRLDADSFAVLKGAGAATDTTYHEIRVVDFANTTGFTVVNSAERARSESYLSAGNTSDTASEAIRIGARADDGAALSGRISEVVIGNAVPSEGQIEALQENTELYYFGEVL